MTEILDITKVSKKKEAINLLVKTMLTDMELINEELEHIFTPSLYTRVFKAPAGTMWVSRTHETTHPFFVLDGVVSVWKDGEVTLYEGGQYGITTPGTTRILYVWHPLTWVTCHANPENKNEKEIVAEVTEEYNNPLLDEELKQVLLNVRNDIMQSYLTH